MDLRLLISQDKKEYQKIVTHVIQSWEWGEFRKSLGLTTLRFGLFQKDHLHLAFTITLHKIPFTNLFFGYLPKGPLPNKELAQALKQIGKDYNCAFIKIEPNILSQESSALDQDFKPSPKALFTKYNFVLDLHPSEEELLKNMHQKTRYNIKVAQKHGVIVEEREDDKAFKTHLELFFETTKRQGYLAHDEAYHQKVWNILKEAGVAKLLIAFYTPEGSTERIPLCSWMLFHFQDTLYYPYGGSSDKYRNTMASTLVAWEAIKLGKKLKCQQFDLWGAGDPNASENDHYAGFTRFKKTLGAQLVEYLGTYDLVFNYPVYWVVTFIDKFTKLKALIFKLLGK